MKTSLKRGLSALGTAFALAGTSFVAAAPATAEEDEETVVEVALDAEDSGMIVNSPLQPLAEIFYKPEPGPSNFTWSALSACRSDDPHVLETTITVSNLATPDNLNPGPVTVSVPLWTDDSREKPVRAHQESDYEGIVLEADDTLTFSYGLRPVGEDEAYFAEFLVTDEETGDTAEAGHDSLFDTEETCEFPTEVDSEPQVDIVATEKAGEVTVAYTVPLPDSTSEYATAAELVVKVDGAVSQTVTAEPGFDDSITLNDLCEGDQPKLIEVFHGDALLIDSTALDFDCGTQAVSSEEATSSDSAEDDDEKSVAPRPKAAAIYWRDADKGSRVVIDLSNLSDGDGVVAGAVTFGISADDASEPAMTSTVEADTRAIEVLDYDELLELFGGSCEGTHTINVTVGSDPLATTEAFTLECDDPVGDDEEVQSCTDLTSNSDDGWTDQVDVTEDSVSVEHAMPDGAPMDGYCVATDNGAVVVELGEPVTTVLIEHPGEGSVRHWQVHLATVDDGSEAIEAEAPAEETEPAPEAAPVMPSAEPVETKKPATPSATPAPMDDSLKSTNPPAVASSDDTSEPVRSGGDFWPYVIVALVVSIILLAAILLLIRTTRHNRRLAAEEQEEATEPAVVTPAATGDSAEWLADFLAGNQVDTQPIEILPTAEKPTEVLPTLEKRPEDGDESTPASAP